MSACHQLLAGNSEHEVPAIGFSARSAPTGASDPTRDARGEHHGGDGERPHVGYPAFSAIRVSTSTVVACRTSRRWHPDSGMTVIWTSELPSATAAAAGRRRSAEGRPDDHERRVPDSGHVLHLALDDRADARLGAVDPAECGQLVLADPE